MDVPCAGSIDPEVKEGRAVGWTTVVIVCRTTVSNYCAVDTLLAVES